MTLSFLNWQTFTWLLLLTTYSIQKIVRGSRLAIYFVIPVLFIFCGLPLFLDEIAGPLTYYKYPGFALASSDEMTNILYCLYISVVPIILLWLGRPKGHTTNFKRPRDSQKKLVITLGQTKISLHFVLYVLLISPIVLAILSPNPKEYLTFSSTLRLSNSYQEFHSYLTAACNLAVFSGCYLIAIGKPKIYGKWPRIQTLLPVVLFMLIATWIHGKRNIIITLVVLLLLALQYRGILRGVRTYILIVTSLLVVMGYSFFFQIHTDRVNTTLYENYRIDFGRDHSIKMTIFAELHPETMRILEHRGQSILFLFTAYIPRKFWPEKPLPYAQYFTSAIFFTNPRLWGWGVTTSWLEEAIANFSWLGMLIGPLCIAMICRFGNSSKDISVQILTPLIASLLLVVQAIAFAPLFLLWFYGLIRGKLRWKVRIT